jgi:hypothetical protein
MSLRWFGSLLVRAYPWQGEMRPEQAAEKGA